MNKLQPTPGATESQAPANTIAELVKNSKDEKDQIKAASPPSSTFKERKLGVPTVSVQSIAFLLDKSKGETGEADMKTRRTSA